MIDLEKFESNSDPGTYYQLSWTGTRYLCSCPGFKFSKSNPKSCRHVKSYQEVHDPPQVVQEYRFDWQKEIREQWEYVLQMKYRRHF